MKNVVLFFITCIIATIGFFAALSMKTPWIGFGVAFSVWLLFIWITTEPQR
ncbi:hypothetical protein [Sphingobacterium sp. 18053]|uniref:hypothetical protein n=1 Tax=Sphingobacterium sp. 18053 TaxID=2681401 RepID=UPI0013567D94|nr:hypothetical protein [Sphingobacterium sp. 18053]